MGVTEAVFSICNSLKNGKVLQVEQKRLAWAEDAQIQKVLLKSPGSEQPRG